MIHFVIPVEPAGQMRPRASSRGGFARMHKDKKQVARETFIESAWVRAGEPKILEDGPIRLEIVSYLARPAGHYRKNGELSAAGLRLPRPTKKPDLTNIAKMIEDVLNAVGAWPDDKNIVEICVTKLWSDHGSNPRGDRLPCSTVHANLIGVNG